MKYILLSVLSVLLAGEGFGNSPEYAAAAIPKALLENANVVKRMEDERIEIVGSGEMIYTWKYALTILNENGSRFARLAVGYDKITTVRSIEGALFDEQGRQLRKLKDKEVEDRSSISDISLFEDNRVKVHAFYYNTYPYTVEYEIVQRIGNTYSLPMWMPQQAEYLSVEKSRFTVIAPQDYVVRHKAFNYSGAPAITMDKNKKVTTWQVGTLAAIVRPFGAPRWNELTTALYLAPADFEMQGYKGNASNWESLGKFQIALNEGRDRLPDHILQTVQRLTAGITDNREKIKVLYQFLQQNTRYISIQLGIGGLQPFEAAIVAEKGYGDCKALSNYMYSLLKAAGIRSYYTWVHAGESMDDKYVMEDFPSDQFNHIILCVPLQQDTMWLECTNQSVPAGYMGAFTGNRKALLITENGGKLVSTPRYGLKENLQTRSVKGILQKDGNLEVKVRTVYEGLQQDDLYGMLNALSAEKVKKLLNEMLDLSTYDIQHFHYDQRKDLLPRVSKELGILVSSYATVSGKRLFISPNLLNRGGTSLTDTAGRIYDYQIDFAYRDVDYVEITVPEGYVPEALPADVVLKTKFGTYSSTVRLEGSRLLYFRTREQYAGRFPASDGSALAAYYAAIYKADRSKVVLVKKD